MPSLGRLHQFRIVKRGMHVTGVDQTPAVTEAVRIVSFDVESILSLILKNSDRIVPSLDQQIYSLSPQCSRIETIEENGTAAPLGMADLSGEDRFLGRIATPVSLKVSISQPLNQLRPQCFGRPG